MERPSRSSVAGPFSGETFTSRGITSRFSRRSDTFVVRTDGPAGVVRDFDVAYTFGVYPLQQYLIALPGGRLQALGIAWDAQPLPGGQRWFDLYPSARHAGDVQHWTSRPQNWNSMCADCHSTGLRKRYVEADDSYNTTWTDLNVACEACHGPGSRHVTWARGRAPHAPGEDDGLARLGAVDGASWTFDLTTGIAHRDRARTSRVEVEMCARCHSRRTQLADDDRIESPLMVNHRPALLDQDLYFADGQIRDEVYEYGSFVQSRMYANGVTCSDCHEAHRPEIVSQPDELCRRCHQEAKFASSSHHHHEEHSAGSRCVECHMPTRTYMTVDARRDHSFRVPRPDLTVTLGTPNACGSCHANRPAAWAAQQIRQWFGDRRISRPHYAESLAAGRSAAVDAESRLLATIDDPEAPAIVKATVVSLLRRWIDSRSGPVVQRAAADPDALVRMAAVDVLATVPEHQGSSVLVPLLDDPVRTVRIQAARALATASSELTVAQRTRLSQVLAEWEAAQRFNADSAGARVSLGALYAARGETDRACAEYQAAAKLEPYFAPASINLADLYRAVGRDDEGERVLREALSRTPQVAALHRTLGLLLVRRKNLPAALNELHRAAELAPDDWDEQYTYAVALYSTGHADAGIALLDRTYRAHPGDRTILTALVSFVRERGDLARAEMFAERLVALSPDDRAAGTLLAEIRQSRVFSGTQSPARVIR